MASPRNVPGGVVVEVADTGPGIPEQRGHSGLGLYLAYRIVLQHRGRLSYQSSPQGTVFTVSLPVAA